jgi:isopropylmalate/homocitrate/citramalate synthase
MDGMDPTVITEIAEYFQKDIGYTIPDMTPFVGRNFNVTRAGIHADGLMKDKEIYTIFDTKKILNKPASVQISKTSGLAGIAYWVNQHFGLEDEEKLGKHDPLITAMKDWIDQEYEDGRQNVMTDRELEEMLERLAPGRFRRR